MLKWVLGGFEDLPLPLNPVTSCFLKICAFLISKTLDSPKSGMGLRFHTGLLLVRGTKRIPALPGGRATASKLHVAAISTKKPSGFQKLLRRMEI